MKQWLFRWGPAILMMGLIFIASSTSGDDIPEFGIVDYVVTKGAHLLVYALLGAAFLHGISRGGRVTPSGVAAAAVLLIFYAASDEWHQSFTPERHPSPADIVIDTVGGLLGMAALCRLRKMCRKTVPGRLQPAADRSEGAGTEGNRG